MPGTLRVGEDLTVDECWNLLTTQQTGRVGFVRENAVNIFPVNYTVLDRGIYFRTAEDGDIGRSLPLEPGAFQVDVVKTAEMAGWAVLAQGAVELIEDEELLTKLWGSAMEEPWASGRRTSFVGIRPVSVTGRRVHTA
ncbi:MAG TPA: pyridoxamine 5'-phosphate oxidase family protein [Arthrobacter sp.]|nr:pyridoxamine 5'-phosphate oxidase family protein [Arthrobacter sp.]